MGAIAAGVAAAVSAIGSDVAAGVGAVGADIGGALGGAAAADAAAGAGAAGVGADAVTGAALAAGAESGIAADSAALAAAAPSLDAGAAAAGLSAADIGGSFTGAAADLLGSAAALGGAGALTGATDLGALTPGGVTGAGAGGAAGSGSALGSVGSAAGAAPAPSALAGVSGGGGAGVGPLAPAGVPTTLASAGDFTGLTGTDLTAAQSAGSAAGGGIPSSATALTGQDASAGLGGIGSDAVAGGAGAPSATQGAAAVNSLGDTGLSDIGFGVQPDAAGGGGAAVGGGGGAAAPAGGAAPATGNWLQSAGGNALNYVEQHPIPALSNALAAGGLLESVMAGNKKPEFQGANVNAANALESQGNQLQGYLASGTLPPGIQAGLNQARDAAIATVKSQFAARGASGSSAETDAINNINTQVVSNGAGIAQQLLAQGISESEFASQIYANLMNTSIQQDQNLSNSIATFAGALGRGSLSAGG